MRRKSPIDVPSAPEEKNNSFIPIPLTEGDKILFRFLCAMIPAGSDCRIKGSHLCELLNKEEGNPDTPTKMWLPKNITHSMRRLRRNNLIFVTVELEEKATGTECIRRISILPQHEDKCK